MPEDVFAWVATVEGVLLAVAIIVVIKQRRSRQALRDTRYKVDSVPSGDDWTWTIDREGCFIGSSSSVEQMLGFSVEEIMGRDSIHLLLSPPDGSDARLELAKFAAHRQGWMRQQMSLVDKEGRFRILESTAAPLLDAEGELIGWQGASRDVMKGLPHEPDSVAREPIESVMRNDQVRIEFQPIVDLRLGQTVGVEALSRFMTEPYRTPDRWFRAAHGAGLGVELELYALRQALSALSTLREGIYLSLNVSPVTLTHASLYGYLCACDSSRIILELTEHASISDDRYPLVRGAVAGLSELGIRLAIDDAGAGFSSLHHVLELGPDLIKLDRSMVKNIDTDPTRQALAASLAGFAAQIGAAVVAEGIENEEQLRAVRAAGVQFGQGFGIAMPGPLPASVTSELLSSSISRS